MNTEFRPLSRPLLLAALIATLLSSGCASTNNVNRRPVGSDGNDAAAKLTPVAQHHRDLVSMPAPKGKMTVAVYSFRDQTGQYKPAPDSSFSTSVTQGAASMMVKALLDSKWFIPVEREGLQDLLTERKVIRAVEKPGGDGGKLDISTLIPAHILLQGGIVGYESNVRTGGTGASYLGVGASEQYRADQVTVSLRAVDIRTGRILGNVSTTKTILSRSLDAGVFRFVSYKNLVQLEAGYTRNEPVQLCVMDAIESAVIHLIVQGVKDNIWELKNPGDMNSPLFQSYLDEQLSQLTRYDATPALPEERNAKQLSVFESIYPGSR